MLYYRRHYDPQHPPPGFGCPETEIVVQEFLSVQLPISSSTFKLLLDVMHLGKRR